MNARDFTTLYTEIYPDLYRFALYIVKHPQDAEDVVSEAVINAYRNFSKLRSEDSFKSWMFTIVRNQCMKKFRDSKPTEEIGEWMSSTEDDLAGRADVRQAMMQLSEEDRSIISMSVFGGYQSDEIGQMLEMKPATVRSRKNRAYAKLRDILKY